MLNHGEVVILVVVEESCGEAVIGLRGRYAREVQVIGCGVAASVVYTCSSIGRPYPHVSCCLECAWCVHRIAEMLCWRAYNGVGLTNLRSRSLSRSRSIIVM